MYLWALKPKQLWYCTEEGEKKNIEILQSSASNSIGQEVSFTILLSPFSFKYKIVV